MSENINLYKTLYQEKKFEEIIYKIENLENTKTPQILHILGICKLSKKNVNKDDKLSAREDFRQVFEKDKYSNIGIEALTNFINLSVDFLKIDDALNYYSEVKDKFSNNIKLLKAISRLYQFSLRIEERLEILNKIIELNPSSIEDWCSYIYVNNFRKNWNKNEYYNACKKFSENIKIIDHKEIRLDKDISKRKIKIAFFSSDINKNHSITFFLKSILENINLNKYELYVISNAIKDVNINDYKTYIKDWYNIKNLNDFDALNFIRSKKLDIVFDLMGFTSDNRISLFKNKLAPIQISWLGYCNTLGLEEIDYIFTDANLIFEDEQKYYTEKIIKLETIWSAHVGFTYKRKKISTPAIKKGVITFGSFNNYNKISDENIETWSKILKKVNNSKLILKSSINLNTNYFKKKIEKMGISSQIQFIPRTETFIEHLNYYDQIDFALDTFPYNGVTTSFEAIWKGVPVLTIKGFNFNSRCGSSIIKNLGVDYLIAKDKEDYILKALYLCNNLDKLNKIRDEVFDKALSSPLFNTKKFSKDFEKKLEFLINKELKNN